MVLIPRREWVAFSHRLIQHGRKICVARKPQCDVCPLNVVCPRMGSLAPALAEPGIGPRFIPPKK